MATNNSYWNFSLVVRGHACGQASALGLRFISYDITGLSLHLPSTLFFRFPICFHDPLRYPLNISTRCGNFPFMYIIHPI